MSVGANGKALAAATKELSRKWRETREWWHDRKSEEFEQRYLAELDASVDRVTPVFDQLDKVLNRARNECE